MSTLPMLPYDVHQYSFDPIIKKILQGIQERNWLIPNIIIVRGKWANLDEKEYSYVKEIHGSSFKLFFETKNRFIRNKRSDTAIVTQLILPREELIIDGLGFLHYWQYIGSDWETDQAWWLSCQKNNIANEKYYYWYGDVFLWRKSVHDSAGKPMQFLASEVSRNIADWLQENVLEKIS